MTRSSFSLPILALTLVLGCSVAAEGAPDEPKPAPKKAAPKKINVDVQGVDLADLMEQIGASVGRNILVDPDVTETVTLNLRDIPWRQAVEVIAKMTRCTVEERAGGILLLTQPARVTLAAVKVPLSHVVERIARTAGVRISLKPEDLGKALVSLEVKNTPWLKALAILLETAGVGLIADDEGYRIVPLAEIKRIEAEAKKRKPAKREKAGKSVSVDVEDVSIADVMEQIGNAVGRNILVDPAVDETVTVYLRDIPWREAVEVIAKMTRCEIEERQGGILLLTQPPNVLIQTAEAPVEGVLRLLAAYAKKKILFEGAPKGRVTCELTRIRWLRGMHALAKSVGLSVKLGPKGLSLTVEGSGRAAPVKPPLKPGPARSPQPDEKALAAQVAKLKPEIDKLFKRTVALAEARDVDKLIAVIADVRKLISRGGIAVAEAVKAGLARWDRRLEAFGEVRLGLEFQVDIQEGNLALRALARAISDKRYSDAPKVFKRVKEIKDRMYGRDREVFHRNAEALFLRGKSLLDRAAELKRTVGFATRVTVIVVVPPGDERSSALVDDRVYREGETLLDAKGKKIPGLVLKEITRGVLLFDYKGTLFTRDLGAHLPVPPLPRGTGVVILNNGSVFAGKWAKASKGRVSLSWVGSTQSWELGRQMHHVRWSSSTSDRPTAAYQAKFGDTDRFPLDQRYHPLLERLRREKRYRDNDLELVLPPK
jgi:hypothetical protein